MGVNTPAWSVVIAGLEHPDSPYSVAEYKNMVGRAGRLGFTPKGKSFLIAPSPADAYRLWEKYVRGKPESLVSRFADQEPLSLVCRVLATASASRTNGLTERELIDFIRSTFGAHQTGELIPETTIGSTLRRLVDAGLAEPVDERFRLTELGRIAGELGIQVESVVRVARALRGLSPSELSTEVFLAATQMTVELDDVIFPVHKKSVQERQRWQGAIQSRSLPMSILRELRATDDATYTARCKRLSADLMWLDGTELNRIEASLLRHLPGDNAAGPIRASAERTRDLIGVVARIGTLATSTGSALTDSLDGIIMRLELGIPADLLWLATELKRGVERGDYLSLKHAGLVSADAIDAADETVLASVVHSVVTRKRIRDAVEQSRNVTIVGDDSLPMPPPTI